MAGTVWINAREKRLSRLEGQLVANVDFGYGLLGRLDKGGSFEMERVEVVPGNWKTRVLDVHITGHVILLKSIGKDQTERRSDFRQVPANLTLEAAEAMLEESVPPTATRSARLDGGPASDSRNGARKVPVAMALKYAVAADGFADLSKRNIVVGDFGGVGVVVGAALIERSWCLRLSCWSGCSFRRHLRLRRGRRAATGRRSRSQCGRPSCRSLCRPRSGW